jgi:Transglutaminase-like superfamily
VEQHCVRQLLALSNLELARFDPLAMNLLVAKEIPALAHLDIPRYQRQADEWAIGVQQLLRRVEGHYWKDPARWRNDLIYFRLGVLCQYIDCDLGVSYREDQREVKSIRYTDPSDLFLNGVMDTRRGTCGNMAALHVALGWRLGWPVSLACVGTHFICRYDDGKVRHNIEATQTGNGGFKSDPDDELIQQYRLPRQAITSGSDLRAVTPRELLGIFVGLRARHARDIRNYVQAERDYLLARYLFPAHRINSREQLAASARCNMDRFESLEPGHPTTLWALGRDLHESCQSE